MTGLVDRVGRNNCRELLRIGAERQRSPHLHLKAAYFLISSSTGENMKHLFGSMALLVACLFSSAAFAQDTVAADATASAATGTLVVDIKPFSSEKPLPKKVDKQLK